MSVCLAMFDLKQVSSTLKTGWYVGAGHMMCTCPDFMYRQNAGQGTGLSSASGIAFRHRFVGGSRALGLDMNSGSEWV